MQEQKLHGTQQTSHENTYIERREEKFESKVKKEHFFLTNHENPN